MFLAAAMVSLAADLPKVTAKSRMTLLSWVLLRGLPFSPGLMERAPWVFAAFKDLTSKSSAKGLLGQRMPTMATFSGSRWFSAAETLSQSGL